MYIEEITAYKTIDGAIFDDHDDAVKHMKDLLGQELDGLMRLSKITLTRTDEYKLITGWMAQEKELKKAINAIYKILNSDRV